MITLEYVWEQFDQHGYFTGEEHDEYSRRAIEVANGKGIMLARWACLDHGGEDFQIWAPVDSDTRFGSWDWFYDKSPLSEDGTLHERDSRSEDGQKALELLLNIFDIPLPEDTADYIEVEDILL